jgi:hypothetical protein
MGARQKTDRRSAPRAPRDLLVLREDFDRWLKGYFGDPVDLRDDRKESSDGDETPVRRRRKRVASR